MKISSCIIYFTILSFIGYVYETIAMSIWGGKFENRGFLFGPIIPIYGLGSLLAALIINISFPELTPLQTFLIGAGGSFVLEYPTHYIMEKVFHQKWWDYSKAPLNINGRVCLPATIGFGIGVLIIVYVINPFMIPFVENLNETFAQILSYVLTILITADWVTTVAVISDFEERIDKGSDKFDEKITALLSNILDEDDPLNDKFYSAVGKVNEKNKKVQKKIISKVPDKTKKKAKDLKNNVKDKATVVKTRTEKFYENTIIRVAKYRKARGIKKEKNER